MTLEYTFSPHEATAIFTNSQSLLKATQNGAADAVHLERLLDQRADKITPGLLVMKRRVSVLSKRQKLPTVLLFRRNQLTYPPTTH